MQQKGSRAAGMLAVSPREAQRLEETLAMLPADARTGLEAGFYDLRLTQLLSRRINLVSIDLPHRVPAAEQYRLAFADVTNLPFRERQFDVVICTEVLEHLGQERLETAVAELCRVSARYVLVSVPYRQRLAAGLFKCAGCSFIGHSMGHVQSFDRNRLQQAFAPAIPEMVKLVGEAPRYAPNWLYRATNIVGRSWNNYEFGLCPRCGRSAEAVSPNMVGQLLRRIIWRIERYGRPRPAWMLSLFRVTS